MADFDPYHRWLGISPKDQQPNHLRLLGIESFECEREVIENAAEQQTPAGGHASAGRRCRTDDSDSLTLFLAVVSVLARRSCFVLQDFHRPFAAPFAALQVPSEGRLRGRTPHQSFASSACGPQPRCAQARCIP